MTLLTLTPANLVPGGLSPANLTALLAASPLSSNTGVVFTNDGRSVLVVQTGSGGSTTVTSDIPLLVQGEAVTGQVVTQAASLIDIYGAYPSQFDRADGTYDVEIDFGTPANVTGVVVLHIGGVV